MATEVASLFGTLSLRDDGFNAGLRSADQNLSGLDSRLKTVGGNIAAFGGAVSLGLTTPILAAGAAATKTAIDMESAFTGVIKTVDATDEEIATLRSQLNSMATDMDSPVAALENAHLELFQIAEAAGQLGVAVEDIDEFSETVAMLAMTTDIAAQDGAMALAQFANITQFPTNEAARLGDVIADLGNNSATTESQILEMGKRIATLSSLGMDEAELLGFSAAISSVGISAELGGTNFTKGVNDIIVNARLGNDSLKILADASGITADEFQRLANESPTGAIMEFIRGLEQMEATERITVLEDLGITAQETQRVFLSLAGNTELVADSLNIAGEAFTGNGALMTEAQTRAGTTASQFNILRNNVNQLASVFGEVLLPPINRFLPIATAVIASIGEMNPMFVQATVVGLGLAASIGPIITVVGGLTTAIGLLMGPLGLAVAGVAAFALAWKTDFMGIRDAVTGVMDTITPIIQDTIQMFRIQWGRAGGDVGNFFTIFEDGSSRFGEVLSTLFGISSDRMQAIGLAFLGARDRFNDFKTVLATAWDAVSPALQQIGAWFTETALPTAMSFITDTALPAITKYFNFVAGIWILTGAALAKFGEWFTTSVLPVVIDVVNDGREQVGKFINLIGIIGNAVAEPMRVLKDNVLGAVQPIIDSVKDAIQALDDLQEKLTGRVSTGFNAGSDIGGLLVSGQISPGDVFNAVGSQFRLPGRANGGRVDAGQPYMVGERGPEPFIPDTAGTIIPNEMMGGNTYNVTINAGDGASGRTLADEFMREISRRGAYASG